MTCSGKRVLAVSWLVISLAACSLAPVAARLPAVDLPTQWTDPTPAPAPDLHGWWKQFHDATLDALVDQALAGSPAVAEARARLRQARALQSSVDKNFRPEIHFNTDGRQSASDLDSFFQIGVDASWELPLFGRREAGASVAKAASESAAAAELGVRVSLTAEVVRTYIDLRTAQHLVQLQQQLIDNDQAGVALAANRLRLGLGTQSDQVTAEMQAADDRSQLLSQQQAVQSALWRLAVLLGRTLTAPELATIAPQPDIGSISINQLPADLLRTRPEIRLAQADVLRATGELNLSRADRYPRVVINGGLFGAVNITRNVIRDSDFHGVPSAAPTIDLPLFDWGRRKAVVSANRAALNATLEHYRQAVIESAGEVHIALSTLATHQARLDLQQRARNALAQELDTSQHLQQLGLASTQEIIGLQQQLGAQHRALIETRAEADIAFVALFKALGGAALPERS